MILYVVGSKGRLGQALVNAFSEEKVVCLDRSLYQSWSNQGTSKDVSRYFWKARNCDSIILVASGLLDSNAKHDDLISVNYTLPKNIIEGATAHGLPVVTFGTVLEDLLASKNNYVKSKTLLGEYVRNLKAPYNIVTHIQLHTLYGLGKPSSFMFLGQILSALKTNKTFRMTEGSQLREYHHFLDDAKAIRSICDSKIKGVVNLSHGEPISLKDIAQAIFNEFNKNNLLKIGALNNPVEENYDNIFVKTNTLDNIYFRSSLPSIVDYMKYCYAKL